MVLEVFEQSFWMLHHGGQSSKRTMLYSTMPTIARLDHGVLDKATRESKTQSHLVRRYYDKSGKPRFVGTVELSKSQPLSHLGLSVIWVKKSRNLLKWVVEELSGWVWAQPPLSVRGTSGRLSRRASRPPLQAPVQPGFVRAAAV